jgi:deoxyadenosine/deoxycytidine kinase
VGKTSLARRLAEAFGSELVLEEPGENPFLERFYAARRRYALPTQLFFLFQRARQLQGLRQEDMFAPSRVADFLLQKDALFARLNLDDDEFRLYRQVYDHLAPEAPVPDLVIYLQAPVEVLRERIERRGVDYEKGMDNGYLEELVDAYTRFFHRYTDTPLLIINAAEINFVDVEADFLTLLERIKDTRSGRHYFNPLSNA